MPYCTIDDVMTFNRNSDMDVAVIEMLLSPVSDAIDRYCRRTFTAITEARSFDFSDDTSINLPFEVVSVSQIATNASQTFTSSDFYLEPQSGPPYRWIYMLPNKWLRWTGTTIRAVTVTATWGYKATVPTGVKMGTILWVSKLYAASDVQGLTSVSDSGSKATFLQLPDVPPDDVKVFLPHPKVRVEGLNGVPRRV